MGGKDAADKFSPDAVEEKVGESDFQNSFSDRNTLRFVPNVSIPARPQTESSVDPALEEWSIVEGHISLRTSLARAVSDEVRRG
jgi:hypothetical protein